jgi:hypothetical protein
LTYFDKSEGREVADETLLVLALLNATFAEEVAARRNEKNDLSFKSMLQNKTQ